MRTRMGRLAWACVLCHGLLSLQSSPAFAATQDAVAARDERAAVSSPTAHATLEEERMLQDFLTLLSPEQRAAFAEAQHLPVAELLRQKALALEAVRANPNVPPRGQPADRP